MASLNEFQSRALRSIEDLKVSFLGGARFCKPSAQDEVEGKIWLGPEKELLRVAQNLELRAWQKKKLEGLMTGAVRIESGSKVHHFVLSTRPPKPTQLGDPSHRSDFAFARDQVGAALRDLISQGLKSLELEVLSAAPHVVGGVYLGLELAAYKYLDVLRLGSKRFNGHRIWIHAKRKLPPHQEYSNLALGINLARHLVNLPAGILNPESYADMVRRIFRNVKNVKVTVWDKEKLRRERMGLHFSVGQAAEFGPCLVHLRYAPASRRKALAFVGKGVTFDSGGLDIKPAQGMRFMKKDMAGSASCLGLALSLALNKVKQPIEVFLALAENSLSDESFRPGDVLQARNGKWVEVHNTDAEGRLVMADSLALVAERSKDFESVVDVATLTGAIKVALGNEVAGVFSNCEDLSKSLLRAGCEMGEASWRMPLVQKYRGQMNSKVADLTNSVDGFGGAINAALFLESFVADLPWAHFDIYGWSEMAEGPFCEPGGNGQSVQTIYHWIKERK